jgi:hypothetical protein
MPLSDDTILYKLCCLLTVTDTALAPYSGGLAMHFFSKYLILLLLNCVSKLIWKCFVFSLQYNIILLMVLIVAASISLNVNLNPIYFPIKFFTFLSTFGKLAGSLALNLSLYMRYPYFNLS